MQTLMDTIRSVLGVPPSIIIDGVDYGLIFEYLFCGVILLLVISSVFKIVRVLFK